MDVDALEDVTHRENGIPMLTCNCPRCWLLGARDAHPNKLPIFTVFNKPTDAPNSVIVRLFLNDGTTNGVWSFSNVDEAHHVLERLGLYFMPRDPTDPAPVVGTWI